MTAVADATRQRPWSREARPSRLYRIVRDRQASWHEFVSDEARGRAPRREQRHDPRLYRGISMFSSARRAREQAIRFHLGYWVAELNIPAVHYIEVHKTRDDPAHYTVIGLPRVLAQLVRGVEGAR